MKTIRFVGDIHGNYGPYLLHLIGVQDSVQVGDFGFGFGPKGDADFVDSMYAHAVGRHRMIRGNHDDPDEAKQSSHFIKDGTVEDSIMYIGGAGSIDKALRTEGVNWWPGEESSVAELDALVAEYDRIRPDILVTHECPEIFAANVMIPRVNGLSSFKSVTRDALQQMHKIHKPRIHIFGHWHTSVDEDWNGTRMICLNIYEHKDIEVG